MSTIINTRVISVPWPISNWKPMETAPKDGRWIVVAQSRLNSCSVVRWQEDPDDFGQEPHQGWYGVSGSMSFGWTGWLGLDEFNK